jgi:hypothetical protein
MSGTTLAPLTAGPVALVIALALGFGDLRRRAAAGAPRGLRVLRVLRMLRPAAWRIAFRPLRAGDA